MNEKIIDEYERGSLATVRHLSDFNEPQAIAWNTNQYGNGENFPEASSFTITHGIELYAQYESIYINYHIVDLTVVGNQSIASYESRLGEKLQIPDFRKKDFKCWIESVSKQQISVGEIYYLSTTTDMLMSCSTCCTLTYMNKHGSGYMAPDTYQLDRYIDNSSGFPYKENIPVVTLKDCAYSRYGYVFDGWIIDGKKYFSGESIQMSSDVSAQAQWIAESTYSICITEGDDTEEPLPPEKTMFKFLKMIMTEAESDDYIQMSKFEFLDKDENKFDFPTGTTASVINMIEDPSGKAINLLDHSLDTKLFAKKKEKPYTIMINLPSKCFDFSKYYRWQWYTADDTATYYRNPLSYQLFGSTDGENWITMFTISKHYPGRKNKEIGYDSGSMSPIPVSYQLVATCNDDNLGSTKVEDTSVNNIKKAKATPKSGCSFIEWENIDSSQKTNQIVTITLTEYEPSKIINAIFKKNISDECSRLIINGEEQVYDKGELGSELNARDKILATSEGEDDYSLTYFSSTDPELTNILDKSFINCKNLYVVDILKVKQIGNNSFKNCSNLSSIDFPNIDLIPAESFYNCRSLVSANFSAVTSIADYAFYYCDSISSIDCHETTSIGKYSFNFCLNLSTMNISNITSIGEHAFNKCSNLSSIDCIKAVYISPGAFSYCSNLSSINIPKVTSIGDNAFSHCTNMLSIVLSGQDTPPALGGENAFYACHDNYKIYVKNDGIMNTFKSADVWKSDSIRDRITPLVITPSPSPTPTPTPEPIPPSPGTYYSESIPTGDVSPKNLTAYVNYKPWWYS